MQFQYNQRLESCVGWTNCDNFNDKIDSKVDFIKTYRIVFSKQILYWYQAKIDIQKIKVKINIKYFFFKLLNAQFTKSKETYLNTCKKSVIEQEPD